MTRQLVAAAAAVVVLSIAGGAGAGHPVTLSFSTSKVTMNGSFVKEETTPSNSSSVPGSALPVKKTFPSSYGFSGRVP